MHPFPDRGVALSPVKEYLPRSCMNDDFPGLTDQLHK
jgi:hypothetical protein